MTDLLIVAGLVLLLTPLLLWTVYAFAMATGLVLLCAGTLRSIGENIESRRA